MSAGKGVLLLTVLDDTDRPLFPLMEVCLSRLDFGNESFCPLVHGSFRVFQATLFLDPVFGVECCLFPVVEENPEPEVGHVSDLEIK